MRLGENKNSPKPIGLRGVGLGVYACMSSDRGTPCHLFGVVAYFEYVPVDNLPYRCEMVYAAILVVEVVGVFPHVDAENGLQTVANGVTGIGFLRDDEFAFVVTGEPNPSAAEEGGTFFLEFFFEGLEGTELCVDGFGEMAYGFAVLLRSGELREIEVVVEDLSGVVEHSTLRLFDDFFECLSLETTARQQIVEVRHVGVEVLAVVEFYCCCADDGFECRSGVGEFDEFEFSVDGLRLRKCACCEKCQSGMSKCHDVDLLCGECLRAHGE